MPGKYANKARAVIALYDAIEKMDKELIENILSKGYFDEKDVKFAERAHRILQMLAKPWGQIREFKAELKKPDCMYRDTIVEYLERNDAEFAYAKAEKIGTIEQYEWIILRFSDTEYAEKAREKLEDMEYEKAKDNAEMLNAFLTKYPKTKYKEDIISYIFSEANNALANGNLEPMVEFVEGYPEHYEARKALEEPLWNRAKTTKDTELMEKYLRIYKTNGIHFDDAADLYVKNTRPLFTPTPAQNDSRGCIYSSIWYDLAYTDITREQMQLLFPRLNFSPNKRWGGCPLDSGNSTLTNVIRIANISDRRIEAITWDHPTLSLDGAGPVYGAQEELAEFENTSILDRKQDEEHVRETVRRAREGYRRELQRISSATFYTTIPGSATDVYFTEGPWKGSAGFTYDPVKQVLDFGTIFKNYEISRVSVEFIRRISKNERELHAYINGTTTVEFGYLPTGEKKIKKVVRTIRDVDDENILGNITITYDEKGDGKVALFLTSEGKKLLEETRAQHYSKP